MKNMDRMKVVYALGELAPLPKKLFGFFLVR